MNKTELVNSVAEATELSKKDASKAVEAVFETIQSALAEGDKVQIIGFGNFEVRERAARKGRNPQTGKKSISLLAKYLLLNQVKRLKTRLKVK